MARGTMAGTGWSVLCVLAAVALYAYNQRTVTGSKRPASKAASNSASDASAPLAEKTGNYETYRNCTLAAGPHNDGDSFMVRLPNGREAEFRLYFVDTPESAFKSYADGQTNRERIAKQAETFGITPEQAVETGKKAKAYSLGLLAGGPFDLSTCWDSPYHDNRFHAFVSVSQQGRPRWLHELLIEHGYVRIYTKGADLPDGTPMPKHKKRLEMLEKSARDRGEGAWGLK